MIVCQQNDIWRTDFEFKCGHSFFINTSRYRGSIGMLDISGFENFQDIRKNQFEQLLINVTNERLHQYFQRQIFQAEEEDFIREGIKMADLQLAYSSNQGVLSLIFDVCWWNYLKLYNSTGPDETIQDT